MIILAVTLVGGLLAIGSCPVVAYIRSCRFSIRTMLVGVTLCAIAIGIGTHVYRRATLFSNPRPSDVPELIEKLGDHDWLTCSWAADALCKLGPDAEAAIPALIAMQVQENRFESNEDWFGRNSAGEALFKISYDAACRTILHNLNNPNSKVQCSSCYLLGQHRVQASVAVPALVNALDNESPRVRRYATYSLAQRLSLR